MLTNQILRLIKAYKEKTEDERDKKVFIVGSGTMGEGIAHVVA